MDDVSPRRLPFRLSPLRRALFRWCPGALRKGKPQLARVVVLGAVGQPFLHRVLQDLLRPGAVLALNDPMVWGPPPPYTGSAPRDNSSLMQQRMKSASASPSSPKPWRPFDTSCQVQTASLSSSLPNCTMISLIVSPDRLSRGSPVISYAPCRRC